MEINEIRKLISSKSRSGMVGKETELSDDEMPDGVNKQNYSSFTKKFFTKHGWDFIMMQKSATINM